MGRFDDLIPQAAAPTKKGRFDDLIPQAPAAPAEPVTDVRQSWGAGAGDLLLGGWGGEASGALNYALTGGAPGSYESAEQAFDAKMGKAEADNPNAFMGGQITGGAASMLIPGSQALRAPTLAGKALGAGAGGATQGAIYGAGSAKGDVYDRAQGAAQGGAVGGLFGMASPVAGKAVGKVLQKVTGDYGQKGLHQAIEQRASNLYDQADMEGVFYQPQAVQRLVNSVHDMAARETSNKSGILRTAIQNIRERTQEGVVPTLREMNTLKNDLRDAALEAGRLGRDNEARIAWEATKTFEKAVDTLPVVPGSMGPRRALATKREADRLWRIKKKADLVEIMSQRADDRAGQFSQSGLENAARVEARNITRKPYKGDNPLIQQFDKPAERHLLRQMTRGTKPQNLLRYAGKTLDNHVTRAIGTVGWMHPATWGAAASAVGAAGTGQALKQLSNALARAKIEKLRATVLGGGRLPNQSYKGSQQLVMSLLGAQSPQIQGNP